MEARFNQFAGMVPMVDKRLLGERYSQLSRDCHLDSGNIQPLKEPLETAELTDPFRTAAFKYIDDAFEDGYAWLDWRGGPVNVIKSPVTSDQFNRIYYIDPQDQTLKVRSGASQYKVGVPRPNKPSVTTVPRPVDSWIRVWGYWHEDQAGVKYVESTMTEGDDPDDAGARVMIPGTGSATENQTDVARASNWYISSANLTPSPASGRVFVPYFRAYTKIDKDGDNSLSNRGIELGTLIPQLPNVSDDRSQNRGQSDFGMNGVKISARFVTNANPRVFSMSYSSEGATLTTSYVVTFINIFGEESEPSDPTSTINVNPFRVAKLTSLDNGSSHSSAGYAPITKLRVYRVVTGDAVAAFKFVGDIELDSVGSEWLDLALDIEAAETLSTVGSGNPPTGIAGLVHMAGGFFAAYNENSVFFSHPYHPYSWPAAYELTFPADVRALGVSGNTLAVLTAEHPFLVTGYEPETMQQSKLAVPYPCVNPYVTEWGGAILYISNEGLIALSGQAGINLSEKFWSRTQWMALKPETLHMTTYKERVYLWADLEALETGNWPPRSKSGFDSYVLYPHDERRAVNALSIYVQGIWNDLENDALYVIRGTKLLRLEGGVNNMESRYLSRELQYNNPIAPVVVRVIADGYPVMVTFVGDGKYTQQIALNDNVARKVPRMRREKFWYIQIDSRHAVRDVTTSMSMGSLS